MHLPSRFTVNLTPFIMSYNFLCVTSGYTGTPRMRTEEVSDDSRKRRDDGDDEERL